MKAYLPSFFSFKQAQDLVRIGRKHDGGYLVSQADIDQTQTLIGLGIKNDWSFEQDFSRQKKISVVAYDASINKRYFFKQLIKSVFRIDNLKIFTYWLKVFVGYKKFFSQSSVSHVQKFVGLNSSSKLHCTFSDTLKKIDNKKIFLKIDIEGSEYRFLNEIVSNEDKFTGVVIEFHDCDIHLDTIKSFINDFKLNLVHIHANNNSPLRLDDGLPIVLELTFSKNAKTADDISLPHELDMPNNKKFSEYELLISD